MHPQAGSINPPRNPRWCVPVCYSPGIRWDLMPPQGTDGKEEGRGRERKPLHHDRGLLYRVGPGCLQSATSFLAGSSSPATLPPPGPGAGTEAGLLGHRPQTPTLPSHQLHRKLVRMRIHASWTEAAQTVSSVHLWENSFLKRLQNSSPDSFMGNGIFLRSQKGSSQVAS